MAKINAPSRRSLLKYFSSIVIMPKFASGQSAEYLEIEGLSAVLVTPPSSTISYEEDIEAGTKICGGVGGAQYVRDHLERLGVSVAVVPASEIFQALQVGICDAGIIVAPNQDDAQLLAEQLFKNTGFGIISLNRF